MHTQTQNFNAELVNYSIDRIKGGYVNTYGSIFTTNYLILIITLWAITPPNNG